MMQLGTAFPEIQSDLSHPDLEDIAAQKIPDQGRLSQFFVKYREINETPLLVEEKYPNSNINALFSKNPCELFTLDLFPNCLKRSIYAKCESTQAHPAILAASTLASISGFIKTQCCIPESEYFQRLYPNLWIAVIQQSGGFKTTALNKGAYLAHQNLDLMNKKIKELEGSLKGASDERKQEIQAEIKQYHLKNILLPNRTTGPGLLHCLASGQGGVILCSELGEWLTVLEQKYNADLKGLLTDLYDVPKQYVYNTKSDGTLSIREPFISICGMSTIEWIRPHVKATDLSSGFYARFLFFLPPNENHIPNALPKRYQYIDEDAEHQLKEILTAGLNCPKEYTLSPNAKRDFEDRHNALYSEAQNYNENSKSTLMPFLKRWSPTLLKISMIMQLIEDTQQNEIGDQAIAAAWSFMEPAIKSTALLFENELGESTFQRKCSKVKEYLLKKNGSIDRRTLLKSKVLENGAKEYDSVLEYLAETGELKITLCEKKDGTIYRILPA